MKNEIKQALVAKKTKLLALMVALCVTTALWAQNNVITYTAPEMLTNIYLNVGATTFGPVITSHTFSNGIGTITCDGEITTIGAEAFYYCTNLTSITIPNSVTTIGSEAFYRCYDLTSITIPNSVTTIGSEAFYLCSGLTSVTIPNSVTTIGNYAFRSCTGLTSVAIPNSITTIGKYAFEGCKGLTFITIPNSFTTIVDGAFAGCSGLTSVTIPNSVTTIGEYAFYDCKSLTSVTIPHSVTTIGGNAFYCSGLTSVTIPNSVTEIGREAFNRCIGLTSIDVDAANTHYVSMDGVLFNYTKDTLIQYPASNSRTEYIIPNSVTTIGTETFYCCTNLTSITIPNSVTTIGSEAFYHCSGLTSVTCKATTPPACERYCFDMVNIYIPVYVHPKSINAYKQADEWKEFTNIQGNPDDYAIVTCIAENGEISSAGEYIIGDTCTLTAIPYHGYHFTQWSDGSTNNPRTIEVTQDTTFEALFAKDYSGQCGDNLYWQYNDETLNITGSGAMYDGQPWFLFRDSITKTSLPTELTTIGDSAFAGLFQLNSITIPAMVTTIGAEAFSDCYSLYLDGIYCLAAEPPVAQESSFDNYYIYLYVLCDNLRKYETNAVFGLFKYIKCIGAEEKPITGDEVTVDPSADNVTITWPANDDAAEYKLVITKDGIVFCTLTFNAQGQLTGIAFAPNRAGSRMLDAAIMTATGWQFTVTGLDQASKYGYTIDALNASKQSIKHYEGEFATDGYTSLEWVTSDKIQGINKMLLDGHLYILRDGNLYTATGARVK